MNLKKEHIVLIALVIFYTVGVVGLSLAEYREQFLQLTPFNLLLTFGLLTWGNGDYSNRYILSFVIVFLIGFWVEVAGVHSGALFGTYAYGNPLGVKFLEVPLTIGINWFLLAYSTKAISEYFSKNKWLQPFMAALLMVALDVLIEPVAVALDFWQWENDVIPLQNFVMWFATAYVIQLILQKTAKPINLMVAFGVFIVQVFFFGLLNLLL
jgi:putative membrane protein